MANACCKRRVPSSTMAQDGETWTCPKCGSRWVHVCEESDGCWWEPDAEPPAVPQATGETR